MEYSCNLIFAELIWMSRQINLLKKGVLQSTKDLINVLGIGLVTWVMSLNCPNEIFVEGKYEKVDDCFLFFCYNIVKVKKLHGCQK